MKSISKFPLEFLKYHLFILVVFLICFPFQKAHGQSCSYTATEGSQLTWPQGTQVNYYIDSRFPDPSAGGTGGAARAAITTAVNNWNSGALAIFCSNVSFNPVSSAPIGSGLSIYYQFIPNKNGFPIRGVMNPTVDSLGNLVAGTIQVTNLVKNTETMTQIVAHEIGHTFGLNDCLGCAPFTSVMVNWGADGNGSPDAQVGLDGPNSCDIFTSTTNASTLYICAPPPPPLPPPSPTPPPVPPCNPLVEQQDGSSCGESPIVIDIGNEGFRLTSAKDGVVFDIAGTGSPTRMGWTAPGSHNAFLALPQNGAITSGKELFGNFTPQPFSHHPNGFLALAECDKLAKGGNGDGIIDAKDAMYSSLRLWIDENHDGVAQPNEIHTLPEMGVFSISLRYVLSANKDRFGNAFRFRGRINLTDQQEDESKDNRIIYDVFFTH